MYKLTEQQRWYIIFEWKKGSLNVSQVARSFNCHLATIYRVIDYYRRHNDVCYADRYNAGRPRALNSTQIKQLDRIIQENRAATAAELLSLTQFKTTARTIRNYRLSLGYRPRKSAIKVKSNNFDEDKRYEFAVVHQFTNIKNYIFEDECYLGLRDTKQIVWCKRGEPTPKKEISSLRSHVNLIGLIWWNGFVFRRFDGWLNSDTYLETVSAALSGNLSELAGFSYISDGINWHRSAHFEDWCIQNNIELCEWPGYSPNFNAVELVWNIIKQKVKKKNPKSQRELENTVDGVLKDLSLSDVQSCIRKTQNVYRQFVSSN